MHMRSISVSALRLNLAEALEAASGETILIVTRRGKGKGERAIVDLDRLEDLLEAGDPEFQNTVRRARERGDYFTADEVFGNLGT